MADIFESYLRGVQLRAYQTQLDKAAATDQAMAAMSGMPQQDQRSWLGRVGQPKFQEMTPQQGETNMYALDPNFMAVRQQRQEHQDEQKRKTNEDFYSAFNVAADDILQNATDDASAEQIFDERYRPMFKQNFPDHNFDQPTTLEGVKTGRAQAQAMLGGDPNAVKGGGGPKAVIVDGKPVYVSPEDAIGKQPAPGRESNTPMNVQEYQFYQNLPDAQKEEYLKVKRANQIANVGDVPTVVSPSAPAGAVAPLEDVAANKAAVAQAGATGAERGKGSETRLQVTIDEGRDAAKGIPTVRRALELMDSVKTGGFEKAALDAKAAFGVQGADEAELSSALGEAVLADLRRTFGAAFTEKEGAKLENIRAQFGASPEANRRLMQQALTLAEAAAKRAMKTAADSGDYRSAALIKETMDQSLSNPGAKRSIQERGDELEAQGMTKGKILETLRTEGYGT